MSLEVHVLPSALLYTENEGSPYRLQLSLYRRHMGFPYGNSAILGCLYGNPAHTGLSNFVMDFIGLYGDSDCLYDFTFLLYRKYFWFLTKFFKFLSIFRHGSLYGARNPHFGKISKFGFFARTIWVRPSYFRIIFKICFFRASLVSHIIEVWYFSQFIDFEYVRNSTYEIYIPYYFCTINSNKIFIFDTVIGTQLFLHKFSVQLIHFLSTYNYLFGTDTLYIYLNINIYLSSQTWSTMSNSLLTCYLTNVFRNLYSIAGTYVHTYIYINTVLVLVLNLNDKYKITSLFTNKCS